MSIRTTLRTTLRTSLAACGLTIVSVIAGCAQPAAQPGATAQPSAPARNGSVPSDQDIVDAYVYLLSRALVVRQEKMDFDNTGLRYNTIKYNEAGKADFVNPNLDVAYMESWLALDEKSAVVLEVPRIDKRYYTAQFLDGWGEVVTNINPRNYPDHPSGKFAFCLAPCQVSLPKDVRVIETHNRKLKMLARVEIRGDLSGAVALQKQFRMRTVGQPVIAPPEKLPMFTNKDLPGASLFGWTDAFLQSPDERLPADSTIRATARRVGGYVALSAANAARVDAVIKDKAVPQFIQYATTKAGKFQNGWLATLTAGNYGGDYWTRTAANYVGIWANTSQEVVYFIAAKDANGQALGGGKAYSLHFPATNLPAKYVKGFWSVILVDFPGYRVVDNELKRYSFNNYSKFAYNPDGSLTLYVAPRHDKAWPKSNWLPAPPSSQFNLTLRMYVPNEQVLQGQWFPEALKPLGAGRS